MLRLNKIIPYNVMFYCFEQSRAINNALNAFFLALSYLVVIRLTSLFITQRKRRKSGPLLKQLKSADKVHL